MWQGRYDARRDWDTSGHVARFGPDPRMRRRDLFTDTFFNPEKPKPTARDRLEPLDLAGRQLENNNRILCGADFGGWDLSGSRFVSADLRGANFCRAYLVDVDFTRARLDRATFEGAYLLRCQFSDCALRSACFEKAEMEDVVFEGSNMAAVRASYMRATRTSWRAVDLRGADFRGADCEYCWFGGTFLSDFIARSAAFRNCEFAEACLLDVDFRGSDLRWSYFWKARLRNCDLRWARIRDADFRAADVASLAHARRVGWWSPLGRGARWDARLVADEMAILAATVVGTAAGFEFLRSGALRRFVVVVDDWMPTANLSVIWTLAAVVLAVFAVKVAIRLREVLEWDSQTIPGLLIIGTMLGLPFYMYPLIQNRSFMASQFGLLSAIVSFQLGRSSGRPFSREWGGLSGIFLP